MYALYFDDAKDFISVVDSKPLAIAVSQLLSRVRSRPIVCIFNQPSGETAVCFRFERGVKTFDGGCCPSA